MIESHKAMFVVFVPKWEMAWLVEVGRDVIRWSGTYFVLLDSTTEL